MKYVTLARTAMIGGLPKGPNDGSQLVTNAVARHLVDNGDVREDGVTDADGLDPEDGADHAGMDEKAFNRAVKEVVKLKLKEAREADAKTLSAALDKQKSDGDRALDAELERIRADGEMRLRQALEAQRAEQDAAFEPLVAEAVAEAKSGGQGGEG